MLCTLYTFISFEKKKKNNNKKQNTIIVKGKKF